MTERDIAATQNPAPDDPEKALLALFVAKFGQSLVAAYLRRHEVESPATRDSLSDITFEFARPMLDSFHILTADLRRSYRRGALTLDALSHELDGRVGSRDAKCGMHWVAARIHSIGMPQVMLPDLFAPERQSPDQVARFVASNTGALKAIDDRTANPELSLFILFVNTFGQSTMQHYLEQYLEPRPNFEFFNEAFESLHEHTAGLRRAYRAGELSYDDLARQLPEVRETVKRTMVEALDKAHPKADPDFASGIMEMICHDLFKPRLRMWKDELYDMLEKYENPLSLIDRMNPSRPRNPRER